MSLNPFSRIFQILSCILVHVASFAQSPEVLNGFKYAVIEPLMYENNERDIHGFEAAMQRGLKQLGIATLDPGDFNNWPTDARAEKCLIIFVQMTTGTLPNMLNCGKIRVIGRNCNDQLVFDEVHRAKNAMCNPPYDCCVPRWEQAAESFFERFTYRFQPSLTLHTKYPEVEKSTDTETSLREYFFQPNLDGVEGIFKSYQSERLGNYRVGIKRYGDAFKAIVLESDIPAWKPGEVKAYFEKSSIPGVFAVKWLNGNKQPTQTFARMQNSGILSIEFLDPVTNQKVESQFIKMFPATGAAQSDVPVGKTSGSGFFISSDGYIATNAHVVENKTKITIVYSGDGVTTSFTAKVVLADKPNDVALLQIIDPSFKKFQSLPYGVEQKADIGERVFTIGYPLNDIMGSNIKLDDGLVSSTSGIGDDVRYYQISVPLQPGNSGGPLFNENGNVIGITSARLNSEAAGVRVENVNYAIKISYLMNLYNMLPSQKPLASTQSGTKNDLKNQVKTLRNYVCLIYAE